MSFFIYNDKLFKDGENIISPDNRGLRYGDGLFETMKIRNGRIELKDYHFERLFSGMEILQFEIAHTFTSEFLEKKIIELCKKNNQNVNARVRLMVFRGDGGLYDPSNNLPNYIIQTWELTDEVELNSNGLIIDIYDAAKKSCDLFSNIKTNNFLPYVMAAFHAKQSKVNDCFLLNTNNRICDTSIANIFIIKDDIIYTPSLTEGCIAGVMRRFIIEKLKSKFKIIEKEISIEHLENADEVFLTNCIKPIRWVKNFRKKEFTNDVVKQIFKEVEQLLD